MNTNNIPRAKFHLPDDSTKNIFRHNPQLASVVQPTIIYTVVVTLGEDHLLSCFPIRMCIHHAMNYRNSWLASVNIVNHNIARLDRSNFIFPQKQEISLVKTGLHASPAQQFLLMNNSGRIKQFVMIKSHVREDDDDGTFCVG